MEIQPVENKEIWKDIPMYEGLYQCSTFGRIKSLPKQWVAGQGKAIKHNGKILKGTKNGVGYLRVSLYLNGIEKEFRIHQLVAMTFLNYIPDGHNIVVDHKDDNKLNNKLENLQLVTNRFNTSKNKKGTSKYIGVSWSKHNNKWRSQIYINGKIKVLGHFKTEEEAAQAYQNALTKHINEQVRKA